MDTTLTPDDVTFIKHRPEIGHFAVEYLEDVDPSGPAVSFPETGLWRYFHALAGTDFAHKRHFPGLEQPINILLMDIEKMCDGTTAIPNELDSPLRHVIGAAKERKEEADIWVAIIKLLKAFRPAATDHRKGPSLGSSKLKQYREDLQVHWERPFLSQSLEALKYRIAHYETVMDAHYAKIMVFIQSSGTGKSRLAAEFGRHCPMVHFILSHDVTSFPPPDTDVLEFLQGQISDQGKRTILDSPNSKYNAKAPNFAEDRVLAVWHHSVAFGFVQAIIETFDEWIDRQDFTTLGELARARHTGMFSPPHQDKTQSPRQQLSSRIASRGLEIANGLVNERVWRRRFDTLDDSAARFQLEDSDEMRFLSVAVSLLQTRLERLKGFDRHQPLFAVAFDEASNLLRDKRTGRKTTGVYVALCRVISCLKDFKIWWFILSTESQIEDLLPVDGYKQHGQSFNERHSTRYGLPVSAGHERRREVLKWVPAFSAFPLSIDYKHKIRPSTEDTVANWPIRDFGLAAHMGLIGRPLWSAFLHDEPKLDKMAQTKLLGGANKFLPENLNHAFAALAFRLALDVCIENRVSLPLSSNSVNANLRIAINIDQEVGMLETITPAEPIVAKAAMALLCMEPRHHASGGRWQASLRTLSGDLLSKGLVSKGLKGELFARLVLVLAHDMIRRQDFVPTFTVRTFLLALFHTAHEEEIDKLPAVVLGSVMNFCHFTSTAQQIRRKSVTPDFYHDLFRYMAALQLSPFQEAFDILLPCHTDDGEFDVKKCIPLQIQVKNRSHQSNPKVLFGGTWIDPGEIPRAIPPRAATEGSPSDQFTGLTDLAPNNDLPRVILLMDLDPIDVSDGKGKKPSSPRVVVTKGKNTSKKDRWLIHSKGHDAAVFGCLTEMGCEAVAKEVFDEISAPPRRDLHDNIVERNWEFRRLDKSFRREGLELPERKAQEQVVHGEKHSVEELEGVEEEGQASGTGGSKRVKTKTAAAAEVEEAQVLSSS